MEIIDAFCGIGPWMKRDRLLPWQPEETLQLMDHFGISKALTHSNFTAGSGGAWYGNGLLEASAKANPRFIPAFTITPYPHADSPQVRDYLAAMRQAQARAVWFMPLSMYPLHEMYGEILDACVAHRLPVLWHRDTTTPADVTKLLENWPELRLILMGCGYMEDTWLYPLLKRYPELRICVGHFYIPADGPHRFLKEFPAERLIFGSGLPFFSPGGLIAHLAYAQIKDSERAAILGGNMRKLMDEVRL
ncbi:MAG: amidohydrolase family protein [bacterium]